MMKLPLLLCLIAYSIIGHAQKLSLKNTDLILQTTFNQALSINVDQNEIINGRYYRIFSFSKLPSNNEKKEMNLMGIRFLDYLPINNYLVSIPEQFSLLSVGNYNISHVEKVPLDLKFDPVLFEMPYPDWANEGDLIKISILLMRDAEFDNALNRITQKQIRVVETDSYSMIISASIDPSNLQEIIQMEDISYVSLVSPPGEPEDIKGNSLHRSNAINTAMLNGRKYDGTGVSVAVNDDGYVGPHIDFSGRLEQSDVANDFTGDHGDMVAGILGGAGNLNPMYEGMAKGAKMHIRQYSGSLPGSVLLHQDSGVVLFSSSYSNGCNAGYTSLTRKVDLEIRLNPALIQVFSAGNAGTSNCGYGAGSGWGNITGGHKQGKNVIATANILNNGMIVNSSSRGPANDGRIKPDISANGNGQMSTDPNNVYATGSGTSAAAPGVSGVLAQLYQAYRELNNQEDPNSGLLKGILLNTAEDYGNEGPDFTFGWGRLNAYKAVQVLEENRYMDSSISQGETHRYQLAIPDNVKEVKVMAYWMDREAFPSASKALVNDIDVKLISSNSVYLPWILNTTPNSSSLSSPATKGEDHLNNMEQVSLLNPSDNNYEIEVVGYNVPYGPQEYFLIYEFIFDEITVTYPIGGEGLHPFDVEFIHWDASPDTIPFTIEYSNDNGVNWNTIGNAPADKRMKIWQVPNQQMDEVKIKVSRGASEDQSDEFFTVIKDPDYLSVDSICLCYVTITWNPVDGAEQYEVMVLGDKFMDSIGVTSNTFYRVPKNHNEDFWYTVRAINSSGIKGKRQVAKYYNGNGGFNCSYGTNFDTSDEILCIESTASFVDRSIGCPDSWSWSFTPNTVSFVNGTNANSENPEVRFLDLGNYEVSLTASNQFFTETKTKSNVIKVVSPMELNIEEDFNTSFPPLNWVNSYNDNSLSWEQTNVVQKNGESGMSAAMFNDLAQLGQTSSLISFPFTVDNDADNPFLSFDVSYAMSNQILGDQLLILVSTDCGDSFSDTVYIKEGHDLKTSSSLDVPWLPSIPNHWRNERVSLYSYRGQTIKVSFQNVSRAQNRIYLDNINIHDNLDEKYNPLTFNVFPNPNTGNFQLFLENNSLESISLEIFDITGKVTYSNNVEFQSGTTKLVSLNLSKLAKGVYYIRVSDDSNQYVKSMVIR